MRLTVVGQEMSWYKQIQHFAVWFDECAPDMTRSSRQESDTPLLLQFSLH